MNVFLISYERTIANQPICVFTKKIDAEAACDVLSKEWYSPVLKAYIKCFITEIALDPKGFSEKINE